MKRIKRKWSILSIHTEIYVADSVLIVKVNSTNNNKKKEKNDLLTLNANI